MQRKTRWTRLAAALLACGVGSAAWAQEVVRLGVLTDMSGADSDLAGPGSVLAAQMAVEDVGGEVGGRKVVVVSADHQRKPDVAATIATRWYDQNVVDVILDVPPSSAALAVQEVARARKKMVIFSTAGTSMLTGKACSPTGFHWTYDTAAVANGTAGAVTRGGGNTWYFVTSDYAFGHAMQNDATAVIQANGGKVVGAVRHPLSSPDFSSFLLQAQASGAQVVGLANSVNDMASSVRQAREFGLVQGGQKVAALLSFIVDIHGLGLDVAQGTVLTESFYWDLNDETRAWSRRFAARHGGRMPTMTQAGVYSAARHYLKAVQAADSVDATVVAEKMRAIPVNDFMTDNARVLPNGWVQRDFYLFEVKKPEESTGPWDYYKLIARIPADSAKNPQAASECPLMP